MPREGQRFSFETVSEPVSNPTWTSEDYRRIPYNLRPDAPVSRGDISPVSPLESEGVSGPSRIPSSKFRYLGNGAGSVVQEEEEAPPPPPVKDSRRATMGMASKPPRSFLDVRHTIESVTAPEMVERGIPHGSLRRKPVAGSPRAQVYPDIRAYPPRGTPPRGPSPRFPSPNPQISVSPPNAQHLPFGHSVEIGVGPRRPSRLKGKSRWPFIFMVLTNVFFFLLPMIFFALAIAIGVQDTKSTDDRKHWKSFQNLMNIAGTAYPIVFAALAGRAALKVAEFRLERGVKLSALEQIMGSRTFGSMLGSHIQLRSFNLLGIGFLLLWTMSPIGSQAVLRLMNPELSSTTSSVAMSYFDTDTESLFAGTASLSSEDASQIETDTTISSIYTTALYGTAESKNGTMDLFGNVKIPFQSSLLPSTGNWSSPNGSVVYSSLIGIPIATTQTGATTNFSMESSYMELTCGDVVLTNAFTQLQEFVFDVTDNVTIVLGNDTYYGSNTTATYASSDASTSTWSIGLNNFIVTDNNETSAWRTCQPGADGYIESPCYLRNLTADQVSAGTLLFQSQNLPIDANSMPTIQAAFCRVQQVYVESNVACSSTSLSQSDCQVVAQRPSELSHAPAAITPLSFPDIFNAISLGLPRATGATQSGSKSDPSVFYLQNPSTQSIASASGAPNLTTLDPTIFSDRLGQLLNTYFSISQSGNALSSGLSSEGSNTISTTGTITTSQEIYKVSWPWFAFFFIATMIMLLAAIVSIICDRLISSPELLNYTSSMIRDSKYIQLPHDDEVLDGLNFTRQHGDLGLKMGDVIESGQLRSAILNQDDAIQAEVSRWNFG